MMRCGRRPDGTGRGRGARGLVAVGVAGVAVATALVGCASPPSVTPLLRVAERAIREEAARVEGDVARDRAGVEASRRGLAAAFEADLAGREALTPDWVTRASEAYAAAREALLRHELALETERRTRAGNLAAAADATRRAAELLETQEALLGRITGEANPWHWMMTSEREGAR